MKSFIVLENKKLSKVIFSYCDDLSYSSFRKALRNKDIKINGVRISSDVLLNAGDKVEIYYTPTAIESYSPIYADENILVVDKKSGFSSEKVFEDVQKKYQTAGFIHRLDTFTSGIMVFSLNIEAEKELLLGFKNRTFIKEYQADVIGKLQKKQQVLEGYLVKDKINSIVKVFDNEVKGSVYIKTGYKVIEEREETTLLRVTLYTGKTHQIRAHLAHIGHPIVGDGKYGDNQFNKRVKASSQRLSSVRLVLKFNEKDKLYYLNDKEFKI